MGISRRQAGFIYMFLSLVTSCLNDTISKYLNISIPSGELLFFRFFTGYLSLIPIMLILPASSNLSIRSSVLFSSFRTKHLGTHFVRGLLLVIGMHLWLDAMSLTSLSVATMMTFTIPLFTLILAPIFLKESISIRMWIITVIGFLGVAVGVNMEAPNSIKSTMLFSLSALVFATLDIINKRLITKREGSLQMLFYSNFIASILLVPLFFTKIWINIAINDILLITILGIGSNMILFFLLKAYQRCSISHLAPMRYIEFILSAAAGYVFFNEKVTLNTIAGAVIVFLCALNVMKKSR